MNICFRTDSGPRTGLGHLMRCVSLANQLKEMGFNCFFLSRNIKGHYLKYAEQNGHSVFLLDERIKEDSFLDPINEKEDAILTSSLLKQLKPSWLVVDSYVINQEWLDLIDSTSMKVMIIDDLANRYLHCDLLLNQNLGFIRDDYQSITDRNSRLLLGPMYALLRPEFSLLRNKAKSIRVNAINEKSIFISLGGSSQKEAILLFLSSIEDCLPEYNVSLTVSNIQKEKEIQEFLCNSKLNINLIDEGENFAEIMVNSTFAIGAAGSTSWERCCMGLPTLAVSLANNQDKIIDELEKSGSIINLGKVKDLSKSKISNELTNLVQNSKLLKSMIKSSFNVCDGLGAKEVAKLLLS